MKMIPERCDANVSTLTHRMGINREDAYAMILLTAVLMDLHPDDPAVAEMILEDQVVA